MWKTFLRYCQGSFRSDSMIFAIITGIFFFFCFVDCILNRERCIISLVRYPLATVLFFPSFFCCIKYLKTAVTWTRTQCLRNLFAVEVINPATRSESKLQRKFVTILVMIINTFRFYHRHSSYLAVALAKVSYSTLKIVSSVLDFMNLIFPRCTCTEVLQC